MKYSIIIIFSLLFVIINASSQIVFTDVEPDLTITEFGQGYSIDFDNNDKIDTHLTLLTGGDIVWTMLLIPDENEDANYVVNQGGNDGGAKVLSIGDEISPASDFFIIGDGWGDLLYGYWVDDGEYGYWTDTQTDKYLGFKFDIDGSYHYGWVHLSTIVHATDDMEFTIHSYAYNSVPNEAILAGDQGQGVIVILPSQNETAVEFDAVVSVNFSYDISEVDLSNIEIKDDANISVTGVSAVLEADNRTFTISHDNFVANMTYTVTVPENSVQDDELNGNEEIVWNFTTMTPVAPSVITYLPIQDATNVKLDAIVSITFNEDITEMDFNGIAIKDAENITVTGVSAVLETDNRTITILHDELAEDVVYTVTIPENSVQNIYLLGNLETIWSFRLPT